MSQKLKPCQFCGGQPVIVGQDTDYYYNGFLSVFAHCGTCQASAPGEGYLTRAEAAAGWNYRHNEETPRERFRREYRDARMVAQVAPTLKSLNPVDLSHSWLKALRNQCSSAAVYAITSADLMVERLHLSTRLKLFKQQKATVQSMEWLWK